MTVDITSGPFGTLPRVPHLPARITESVAPRRLGTPLGGLLASIFGITAPFWFGFVGSALLVAIPWRQFEHIAHAEAT